ncbi:MAG: DUF58 domain-containing protein [Anaerolineae bacterium]|nr:DUF58 domain-containing protein [Anaerolineae bacterium]
MAQEGRATPSRQAIPLFDEAFLRKLERLALVSRRAMAGQLQGERRSPKRGQSVEFADYRPYAAGDDFRRIDWNAYARLERFFIKLFVEEQDLTVHLLLDASASMDWGDPNKLHYARRAAGAIGYVALAGLDQVTVTLLGGESAKGGAFLSPRRGKRHGMSLLSFLAAARPGGAVSLGRQLRAYAAAATCPGPTVLLSDLMDAGWTDGLRALAGRGFEVTVLHILSPDEVNPDLAGDLKLTDVEAGPPVEITADLATVARYRQSLAAWREELRRFCSAREMRYIPLETSVSLDALLFSMLRRGRVLK